MGMKDEELAGLSDEERAAILDDDDDSEILKNIAGNGDDDDDDSGTGTDDDKSNGGADDPTVIDGTATRVDDDGKGNPEANGAEGDGKGATTEAATPVFADEFQPEFKASATEGITEKLAELDTRTAELNEKFKNGEIELPDFMAQKSAIDTDRLNLTVEARQAEWAKQQNADSRDQRWKWEQERFFAQDKSAIYKDDPITLAALNASIKQLASDPANDRRPPGWFLEEADRRVRDRFNMGAAKANANDGKKNATREPDVSKLPKTLANLPAADISETGSDEFAYLEKLDGLELEQALRKMTPEQEARYLGASA